MKLKNFLLELILENSRFEVLLDKYTKPTKKDGKEKKPVMDLKTYFNIILADPTSKIPQNFNVDDLTVQNYSKVKPGSYTNWLLRNFEKPELDDYIKNLDPNSKEYAEQISKLKSTFIEDLGKYRDELADFEKYKQYFPENERNIDNYTPQKLVDYMTNFEKPEKFKKQEEKQELKKTRKGLEHTGGKIDFVGKDWTVVKISDTGEAGKDAAMYYGGFRDKNHGESFWCTSDPNPSYNAFNSHINQGPLYVIFPNDDKGKVGQRTGLPEERYQFHFQTNQFMDRLDKAVGIVNFLNTKGKELKEYFKPEFVKNNKNIGSYGNEVELKYPSRGISDYIALYGLDDLLDSLPKTLTSFKFFNTSSDEIILDLTGKIGHFKNLEILVLENCIDKLPEEVMNLKNLGYLNLPKNKKLKHLPPVENLPNLGFVNLRGSEVVKHLSESFRKTFSDVENDAFMRE
jgi:molecular chaperone GrpE (heat shock protein)